MSKTIAVDFKILKKIFFKKNKNADPRRNGGFIEGGRREGENNNPYLAARRTWNEHVGDVIASRRTWQVIGMLSMLIALASIGGITYIGSKSKFIPYIVQVDKLGQVLNAGVVHANNNISPRIINSTVADFIEHARMVTPDISLERKAIFSIYAHLSPRDPATEKMNEWMQENSPFKKAEKETVDVSIKTVLQQTPGTWQVEWVETRRDRQGVLMNKAENMRAIITVYDTDNTQETTEDQIRRNPLGIYIKDFAWTMVQ